MGLFDRPGAPTERQAEQAADPNAFPPGSQWVVPESAHPRRPTLSAGQSDAELLEVLERLSQVGGGARQHLIDALWGGIPTVYWENAYSASALQVQPQPRQENGVTITTVVACVAAGATGLVQLSDVIIPVSAGLNVVPFGEGGGIMLQRGDTRSLTQTASGPCALVLSGHLSPMFSRVQ